MMSGRIVVFPVAPRTARALAHQLRVQGFWSLPVSVWNGAADLAELLTEYPATATQIAWLQAHQKFLI